MMSSTVTDHLVQVLPSARDFKIHFGETILGAAIRQGVTLPYGCKDGACGSCKCKMLRGDVEMQSYAPHALTDAEKQQGYILTCRANTQSDIVIESRQVTHEHAFPIRKLPVRVTSLEVVTSDVMVLKLQLPAQEHFRHHAGQYIEFILKDGSRRAYSIATAPFIQAQAPSLELHIRHFSGGKFTDHVFTQMKPRDILRIEGPFGSFFLREDSNRPVILLATGTGFAPIKGILEHMRHKQISRPVHFYWGARQSADLYDQEWLSSLAKDMPNFSYAPVLSKPDNGSAWSGRTGYVTDAMLADFPDLSNHEVYACGLPAMVESAQKLAVGSRNLNEDNFYADAFTSEADKLR